ncbi:MAG: anhydro-N-acetylmuramic acid kinase [Gammaproteobacteria bacterium]|nr:MAG: anhydro-N-acetylmuramic acid kinase [Gammaproteobacteria bacterium]
MAGTTYYIGMMSGTSLDGVDAVLARHDAPSGWQVIAHTEIAIPTVLKSALYHLNFPHHYDEGELHQAKVAEHQLTHHYAQAYQTLIQKAGIEPRHIRGIGAHGQTIRHQPDAAIPYTVQLLDGALLSYLTGQDVVCDFRSKDIAAGGQGAPLAPLFHRQLFPCQTPFAVVNIGGIANVSIIDEATVTGFDCGPGNCLMDEWIDKHQRQPFDRAGDWAGQGRVLSDVLTRLLSDRYFSQPAPKSTGRDYFNQNWLNTYLSGNERPVDVMRTLLLLTATGIAQSIPDTVSTVVVVGGGAKNTLLYQTIAEITDKQVARAEAFGMDGQTIEALGFAVLAKMALQRQPANTSSITGAKQSVILGAVYYG